MLSVFRKTIGFLTVFGDCVLINRITGFPFYLFVILLINLKFYKKFSEAFG
jgi:hypothetical protein